MKRAAKVDTNQAEIVKYLRQIGASVAITSAVHKGFPDIIVGWRGRNYMMEIKASKGKLTADQVEFMGAWKGQYSIARNIEDACDILGIVRPKTKLTGSDDE